MRRLSFVLLLFCCLPVSAVSTLNGKLKNSPDSVQPDSVQLEINYMVEKDGKWSRVVDEVTAVNGHELPLGYRIEDVVHFVKSYI